MVKTEKGYSKIETATAVPKGMTVPPPQNKPFFAPLDGPDDIPEWVPFLYGEKVQDVIDRCQEAAGVTASANGPVNSGEPAATTGQEIPF